MFGPRDLTGDELEMAAKMDMSPAEYNRFRDIGTLPEYYAAHCLTLEPVRRDV